MISHLIWFPPTAWHAFVTATDRLATERKFPFVQLRTMLSSIVTSTSLQTTHYYSASSRDRKKQLQLRGRTNRVQLRREAGRWSRGRRPRCRRRRGLGQRE